MFSPNRASLLLLLAAWVVPARAADDAPAPPADRSAIQRDTKAALVETKLPEEELAPMFGELETLMSDYAGWVLEVGPTTAAEEDAEALVRSELEPVFEQRSVALTGQRAIIKLMTSRLEAIRAHAVEIRDAQARVKAEIEDADLGDPELDGSVFKSAKAFSKERHADAALRGRSSDQRPKAADIARADFLPIVQAAELPAKNGDRLCVALGDWMEALALINDEVTLGGRIR